jgi:cell division protein FtsW (lipid II flippase)
MKQISFEHRKVRLLLWAFLLTFASVLTVFSLSSVSRATFGIRSSNPRDQGSIRHNHRLAHLAAFGILAFLLALLGRRTFHQIAALVVVIALGVLIEVSQHRLYDNPLETNDIKDDAYGALAGVLAAAALIRYSRRNALC